MICSAYAISLFVAAFPFKKEWESHSIKHKIYIENKNSINNYYQVSDDKYKVTYWIDCEEDENEDTSGL